MSKCEKRSVAGERKRVLSILAPARSKEVGVLAGRGLRRHDYAHQVGKSLLTGSPTLARGGGMVPGPDDHGGVAGQLGFPP